VAYGTSKAGLRYFATTFAQGLAGMEGFTNVHDFCVDPGGMDTPMRYVAYPEETDKSRLADPTQVARFFTYLAAGWITTDVETGQPLCSGQELVVRRYLPELWPEGGRVSPDAAHGRGVEAGATSAPRTRGRRGQ
jgi:NAD(P)-dependent dehydrogenase (short-subunit alcohol dehydrogenase family)